MKKTKIPKPDKPCEFDSLVSTAYQNVHLALLEKGSSGMKTAIRQAMIRAIDWRNEVDYFVKYNKKNKETA
jgi:hypothetical protein